MMSNSNSHFTYSAKSKIPKIMGINVSKQNDEKSVAAQDVFRTINRDASPNIFLSANHQQTPHESTKTETVSIFNMNVLQEPNGK